MVVDIAPFDKMKPPRVVWVVLLLATALLYWLPVPPAQVTHVRTAEHTSWAISGGVVPMTADVRSNVLAHLRLSRASGKEHLGAPQSEVSPLRTVNVPSFATDSFKFSMAVTN